MRIESLHDALAFFPDIDGFWNVQNLEDAESQIQARPLTVELLTQLARAQALRGDLTKARATLDQARQMMSDSPEKVDPRAEVRWLLEQGRVLCLAMNLNKAHDLFAQAWTLANANGLTFFAVDAALMLSTIRPPKFQNEWLQRALSLTQASTDKQVRMWMSQLLFLEGWHAFDFREFDRALKCFEQAKAQPHAADENWKVMAMEWSRGRTMRALGQVQEALATQQSLLTEMSLSGNISGHVYLEIAECQQLLKQTEQAKSNFELAYGQLSLPGWYADNRGHELDRMKYLYKKR